MKYFRYVVTTLLVLGLFGGYFYYLTMSGKIGQNPVSTAIISVARPYPVLTEPRELSLGCDYHGKNLTVSETLYGSLDEYYKTDPAKKNAYLAGREKDFVFSYAKDKTIDELATKISDVGRSNGLGQDQILDLAACFIQNIPYDDAKAAKILGTDFASQPITAVIPRYPYETLYDKTGICTDKTYLGAAVMSTMGYQTAIMTFDAAKHMSLGVAVPTGYGSFGTNYGIMELTGTGFLVGDVPDLNATAGLAINNFQKLPQADSNGTSQSQLQLGAPNDVISVSGGNAYTRIVERFAIRQQMEGLLPQISAAKTAIQQAKNVLAQYESEVSAAEAAYHAEPSRQAYNVYLTAYNQYLSAYNTAQAKINQYNNLVNAYNSDVEKYRQF